MVGQDKVVNNNGVQIHYAVYGAGEPLMLLHGFPDYAATWEFQIAAFAQDYTVITPTLRGYPPSDVPPSKEDYTANAYVSDIEAILAQEGIEQVLLVGHDVAGAIAQEFSYADPEMVKALVMTNTPPIPTFLPLIEFDAGQQEMSRYTIPYYSYEPGQPKNISLLLQHIRNTTYQAEMAYYLQESPIHGMLYFYSNNYPGPPYRQDLSAAQRVQTVPSAMIWGQEDPYFSNKMIDGLADWFSLGIRLITIPTAGHWSFRDQPERWNAELASFLQFIDAYDHPSIPN